MTFLNEYFLQTYMMAYFCPNILQQKALVDSYLLDSD